MTFRIPVDGVTPTPASTPPQYLYILVRTDMASMGRGKGTAQAVHAGNQFTDDHIIQPLLRGELPSEQAMRWRNEAGSFGTTIALAVPSLRALKEAVRASKSMGQLAAEVMDPEYPLVDGEAFHLIPNVVTTAYVLANKDLIRPVLGDFDLLPNDTVVSAKG